MPPTTADRQALRVHLTSEFHQWVENLLSQDELPLVGSIVPVMTQTPPRRVTKKTKTKAKKKTTTPREEVKTTWEEDKSTAPAAPAREIGQVPAPAVSSPEDTTREDDWMTQCKGKRRRSLDPNHAPQPGKRPRALPTPPATSTKQCHNCQGFGHATVPASMHPYARSAADHTGALYVLRNASRASRPSTTATCVTRTATDGDHASAETGPSHRSPSAAPPLHGKTPWTPCHLHPPPASSPPRPQRLPPAALGHSATSHRPEYYLLLDQLLVTTDLPPKFE